MFHSFSEFMICLREARFGFDVIIEAIKSLFSDMLANPDVSAVWAGLLNSVEPVYKSIVTLLALAAVLVAFFGKKIIGILKFVFFFIIGFLCGTHLLAGTLPPEAQFPPWVVGFVVALVAAVLYRFLYIILYTAAFGYSGYILAYHGFFLQQNPQYSPDKVFGCIIVAIIFVVISLIFKKYIEMAGTAFLGAWLAVWLFANQIYAFTSSTAVMMIPTAIIAVVGVIVQFRTRRRY